MNETQVNMQISNSNCVYDPHNNPMFHEGTQKIINIKPNNSQYDLNTRVKFLKLLKQSFSRRE